MELEFGSNFHFHVLLILVLPISSIHICFSVFNQATNTVNNECYLPMRLNVK